MSVSRLRVVAVAILVLLAASCRGGPSIAPDTAHVTVAGDQLTFTLDDCGRDGATVFLVGQTAGGGGAVLQAVVGLSEPSDNADPIADASGFSVVFSRERAVGAFGSDAAHNIGAARAIGKIDGVRVDGSRVRMSVTFEKLDERNQPTGDGGGSGTLDANCGPGKA